MLSPFFDAAIGGAVFTFHFLFRTGQLSPGWPAEWALLPGGHGDTAGASPTVQQVLVSLGKQWSEAKSIGPGFYHFRVW